MGGMNTKPAAGPKKGGKKRDDIPVMDGVPVTPLQSASVAGEETQQPARERASSEDISRICRGLREGRVLRRQTILKADHYPSCQNHSLPERIDGAPNFRQVVPQFPVYGVAAPALAGLRAVCAHIAKDGQPICWCNLRQEPCIYVNGKVFTLKERDNPFHMMENKGVQQADVEQAEALLKLEVLAEAKQCQGRLLVMDETPPNEAGGGLAAQGELYQYWEDGVNGSTVFTPRELFEMVALEGLKVTYKRVPITDECAPLENDFDTIVRVMQSAYEESPQTAFVYNCAMGRGRTTSGLVISCLTWRTLQGDSYDGKHWDLKAVRQLDLDPAAEVDYSWGEYKAVKLLTKQLPKGVERKAFVDCIIDQASHMQNLRVEIVPVKKKADDESSAMSKRAKALIKGRKYLERYIYLVLFNAYVCCAYDKKSSLFQKGASAAGFKGWLDGQNLDLAMVLDNLTLE